MKNTDVKTLIAPIAKAVRKFHTTIFIVAVVAGLAYAVLSLTSIISDASAGVQTGNSTGTNTQFDNATVERLKAFHTSDTIPSSEDLPEGRINPFSE